MRFATAILAACMTALLTRAQSQQSSVLPRDEAARDPEFFVFRARLQRAVAAHDTAAVMAAVLPRILNSLGGNGGREEFRETWGLAEPEKSQLWAVLGFVLALGGQFDSDTSRGNHGFPPIAIRRYCDQSHAGGYDLDRIASDCPRR